MRDGVLTSWIDGAEFKKVKTQIPDGTAKFAIYALLTNPVAPPGTTFEYNKLRITAGQ